MKEKERRFLPARFTIPESFTGYRLTERLGTGGSGEVWKATDRFGNTVAFKLLRRGERADSEQTRRFLREGRILSRLNHPGICRVLEVGRSDDTLYIAMEHVDGVTLARLIGFLNDPLTAATVDLGDLESGSFSSVVDVIESTTRSGDKPREQDTAPADTRAGRILPLQQSLAIVMKMCDAVQFAHEHGVLHRDIKPSNIMMRRDGEPVLMDFGIAKAADEERDVLTMTGDVFGTVEYMAPEQARSSRLVDERGDVYSLGAVLYQMVTGRKHFVRTGNLYRDLHGLESSRIIRPRKHRKGIEQDFEAIILKALAPEPVRRYRSARHFHEDLRRFLTGEPVHAKSPTPLYVLSKKLSRHRHAVVFSLAAAVLLTVLVGYTISQAGRRSGRWATVAHHSFTPKSSREGATDTAAPLRVGMSPVWFEDARAAGEVRLRLTFRPVRRGWALRLLVNAPVHDDVERPMPGGYVCSVSDSGGGTLEITTGERAPPRLGAATSLSLPDRSALVVGFDHQDDEVCAWIEGAPPLRCLDPLPPFGPHLSRIGIWCPRGNVDVLEIDVRHRTLPREVTPLVAGDALFAAGEMRAAAAGYRSVAEAYAGSQLAEKALVRGMVALLHHPACGWREKHLHELRAVLGQRFPHSRYWPSLEHMVRSSVVSEVAE